MSRDSALRSAVSLVNMPSQLRVMRAAPLPEGTQLVLSVAAGDPEALQEAIGLTGRTEETLVSAAAFFIEQILLCPDSDSYRILGSQPSAPAQELRTHMALLMKWLHPDIDGNGQKSLFAGRVTRAWEDLKTLERREAYDAGLKAIAIQRYAAHGNGKLHRSKNRRSPGGPQNRGMRHWVRQTLSRMFHRDKPFV